jgi:hypothetical protein
VEGLWSASKVEGFELKVQVSGFRVPRRVNSSWFCSSSYVEGKGQWI